jgi:hypothetical protein
MNRRIPNLDPEERQETRALVKSAFGLARSLGINRLVVQADEISDMRLVDKLRGEEASYLGRSRAEADSRL